MADITTLARLYNGAMRNVDLTLNTPVVLSVKLSTDAGVTSTELTKAILDKLILVGTKADADGSFDLQYAKLSSLSGTSGAGMVGILTTNLTNFTPGSTVQSALEGISAQLAATSGVFSDSRFVIHDNADTTASFVFDASAIPTGTSRSLKMANADVDLGKILYKDGTIAVTGDLKPDSDVTRSLGDASHQFKEVFSDKFTTSAGAFSASGLSSISALELFTGTAAINTNSGNINLTTGTVSGSGVKGKVVLNGSSIDASSTKIINLANGTNPNDAVNLSQVSGLISSGGQLKVSAADTTSDYLSSKVSAGVGLSQSITSPAGNEVLNFSVNVDGSSIEITGDSLNVKAGGITSAMMAGSIDATKIADGSVTSTEFQYINSLSSNAQDQIDNKVTKNANITGATKTKVTYDAKGLVTAGADAVTDDIQESGTPTNKYFTDARAKAAAVADSITNGVTDVAPSQNAVFDALALKVDQTTTVNGHALSGNVTVTKADVGLTNVTDDAQLKASQLDTDITLAADSDTKVASQHATKKYIDDQNAFDVKKTGSTMTGSLVMSGATIAMGGSKITGLAAGTSNGDAVRYEQLTALAAGVVWLSPVMDANLIDDTLVSGAFSGTNSDTYIAAATAGGWTAGHAYQWDGVSAWVDLLGRAVAIGDRFLVSGETATAGAGSLAAKDDQIATVTTATPGAMVFSFEVPLANHAVYCNNPLSHHSGHQYNYNGSAWVEFGGLDAVSAGLGLGLDGNSLYVKMGAGIAQLPSDEVGVDVHSNGGLFTTVDNSTESTVTGAQLAIKLNGSTLDKSASGLKVATSGIYDNEINASAAIAFSKLATLASANILVGSAGGVATSVAMSGDVTISNLGVMAIGATKVTNAMLAGSIAYSKLSLTGEILNADLAGSIAYSKLVLSNSIVAGDITSDAITTAKILNANVTAAKLASDVADQVTIVGGAGTALSVVGAPAVRASEVAGEAISGLKAVRISMAADAGYVAGRVYLATNDASVADKFYAIGLVKPGAAVSAADPIVVTKLGEITSVAHGFTIGAPIFLGANGVLVQSAPTASGTAVYRVAIAKTADTLEISIGLVAVN